MTTKTVEQVKLGEKFILGGRTFTKGRYHGWDLALINGKWTPGMVYTCVCHHESGRDYTTTIHGLKKVEEL